MATTIILPGSYLANKNYLAHYDGTTGNIRGTSGAPVAAFYNVPVTNNSISYGSMAVTAGGYSAGDSVVSEYRNAAGVGITGTDLNIARSKHAAAKAGAAIFAGGIGAITNGVEYRNSIAVGATGTALAGSRQELAAASAGANAVFAGGATGTTTLSPNGAVDYRSASGVGATGTAITPARYRMGAATAGDGVTTYAVFAGGYGAAGRLDNVDYRGYNGAGFAGVALASAKWFLCGASSGDNAIFAGGNTNAVNAGVEYRDSTGTGATGDGLSVARDELAGATADASAIFGGGNTTAASAVVDVRADDGTGTTGTNLSAARKQLAAAKAGGSAIFIGGNTGTATSAVVDYRDSGGAGGAGVVLTVARDYLCGAEAGATTKLYSSAIFEGAQSAANRHLTYLNYIGVAAAGTPGSSTYAAYRAASAGNNAIFFGFIQTPASNPVDYRNAIGIGASAQALTLAMENSAPACTAGDNAIALVNTTISWPNNMPGVEYRNHIGVGASGMVMAAPHWVSATSKAGEHAVFATGLNSADGALNATVEYRNYLGAGATGQALSIARPGASGGPAGANAVFVGGIIDGTALYANVDYRDENGVGSTGQALSTAKALAAQGSAAGNNAIFFGGIVGPINNETSTGTVDYRDSIGVGGTGTTMTSHGFSNLRRYQTASAGNNSIFMRWSTVEYRNSSGIGSDVSVAPAATLSVYDQTAAASAL